MLGLKCRRETYYYSQKESMDWSCCQYCYAYIDRDASRCNQCERKDPVGKSPSFFGDKRDRPGDLLYARRKQAEAQKRREEVGQAIGLGAEPRRARGPEPMFATQRFSWESEELKHRLPPLPPRPLTPEERQRQWEESRETREYLQLLLSPDYHKKMRKKYGFLKYHFRRVFGLDMR